MFGDTYIGKNVTPLANKYFIMRFDFSGIDVEESFKKYKLDVEKETNPIILFNNIFSYAENNKLELMILIDKYDNFVNKLLLRKKTEYLSR